MLRNLFDEIVRRRLWPVVALAALVAVAAPLLFLESAPPDAPPASAPAPRTAPGGELPARAQALLSTTAATAKNATRKRRGRAEDPFRAPASHAAKSPAGSSRGSAKKAAGTSRAPAPVPVVITNVDGNKPATSVPATPATRGGTRPNGAPIGDRATRPAAKRAVNVDVRFGRRMPARLHRAIPRRQTFVARGRVIAIFVKYSPNRDKAVFAIAPSTLVTGDVKCRRKRDLCRYVDIPAGKHVRLTTLTAGGELVSRRLDVVRIGRTSRSGAVAAAAASAPANGSCLLGRILTLGPQDPPLASTACKS